MTTHPYPGAANLSSMRTRDLVAAALLLCVTLLVYLPALHGGFLIDDDLHVTTPSLMSWGGLWRIWFEPGVTQQYYPMLHTAFWVEHRLWGDAVIGYHLINVIQHVAASCLVVAIMRRLALPAGWLAGFIFALHPVCVESVAWIAEQKNTLSILFYLSAAYVYLGFDQNRRRSAYLLASIFFAVALLSKTATLTLPAVLLVIFWWKRGRVDWRKDVVPLLPWFVAGVAVGCVTAWVERNLIESVNVEFPQTWLERCLLAGRAFWFYLGKVIWPADLAFIYPNRAIDATKGWQYLSLLGVLIFVGALALRARVGKRGALAAVLIFGGTLFPVLGFFDVYWFVFSPVADHLQYLAMPVIIVAGVAGIVSMGARFSGAVMRWMSTGLVMVMLAVLAQLSWQQSKLYRDAETFYRAALTRNPEAWVAHQNLSMILLATGRAVQAEEHLETVLKLKPRINLAGVHGNLAVALVNQPGRMQEAIRHLEEAVRLRPDLPEVRNNLGSLLADVPGRLPEAFAHCEEAVRLKPDFIEARMNLASFLAMQERFPEARRQLEAILKIDPGFEPARQFLAQFPPAEPARR